MKKITLLIVALIFGGLSLFAQDVPLGMKYQAVARDAKAKVIPNQAISIEINLRADDPESKPVYTEIHQITTNKMGLFSLVIGKGDHFLGLFEEVPWSDSEIWMEISMDEKGGDDFLSLSNAKLLSVPYAFHAGSAAKLREPGGSDKAGSFWKTQGNVGTFPHYQFIGTTDFKDFIFKTNWTERMRITAGGDVNMNNTLNVGHNLNVGNNVKIDNNLTVKKNVYLNTKGGETQNNGPFTVTNQSPTLLSGRLTVDLATDLNASLNVDGPTELQSSLSVNNMRPTTLTGTLLVQKDATFNEHVLLDNAGLSSTSTTTGGLVVNGGVGIGEASKPCSSGLLSNMSKTGW